MKGPDFDKMLICNCAATGKCLQLTTTMAITLIKSFFDQQGRLLQQPACWPNHIQAALTNAMKLIFRGSHNKNVTPILRWLCAPQSIWVGMMTGIRHFICYQHDQGSSTDTTLNCDYQRVSQTTSYDEKMLWYNSEVCCPCGEFHLCTQQSTVLNVDDTIDMLDTSRYVSSKHYDTEKEELKRSGRN